MSRINKFLLGGGVVAIIVGIVYYLFKPKGDKNQKVDNLELLESISKSGFYEEMFEVFKSNSGYYPNNYSELYNSIDSLLSKERITFLQNQLNDPYTDRTLVYRRLSFGDSIDSYILYSLGPNMIDDNSTAIDGFLSMRNDSLIFNHSNFGRTDQEGDIIVHIPQDKRIAIRIVYN